MFQRVAIVAALTQLLAAEQDVVAAAYRRVKIGHRGLFYLQIQGISDTVKAVLVGDDLAVYSCRVIVFATPWVFLSDANGYFFPTLTL